ncbi:MAG: class I SAM-dependent methyltransferase [Opitutales bacterium]
MEKRLTEVVHECLAEVVRPGEVAIDATTGNGRDTVVLARLVGSGGQVFGFDVQAEAIERTRQALAAAGCARQVTLYRQGHEGMRAALSKIGPGTVAAVVFNLGFLPGGDKVCCTTAETTQRALAQAWALLRPEGLLSVLCYTGHPGGREETEGVRAWVAELPKTAAEVAWHLPEGPVTNPPELLLVRKRTGCAAEKT